MNNALKFLLFAAGCAIVVLLITVGMKTANKGKEDIEGNVGQYSEAASNYEDVDKTVYDGTVVLGSEVKRVLEEYNAEDYLSVVVDTSRGTSTSYINACAVTGLTVTPNSGIDFSALPSAKTDPNYINDSGKFLATVYYDDNNVVGCIWFQQQ